MSNVILDVSNLRVEFYINRELNKIAVDGISFQLKRGDILGIVGESGSGKSVTSLAIMGLLQRSGKIALDSQIRYYLTQQEYIETTKLNSKEWTQYRGKKIAMIFQEPMSSFNPLYTIGYQLLEVIELHQTLNKKEAKKKAVELLQSVKVLEDDITLEKKYFSEKIKTKKLRFKSKNNLEHRQIQSYIKKQKETFLQRYPHELSGGQLQRVMIAMAISCKPDILIADEPTTALDVTVQKTILKLLLGLCKQNNISMIFISHDLGVINEVADKILVMYRGKIVERGEKDQILYHPKHDYTKGLIACLPPLKNKIDRLPIISNFSSDKQTVDLFKQKKLIDRIISNKEIQDREKDVIDKKVLLSVKNLTVELNKATILNNITFEVYTGETLGLVGESGCGKSTLSKTILKLLEAKQGSILFDKYEILKFPDNSNFLRKLRKDIQIIFQNPYNSLNPRLTIGQTIMEPMIIHKTEKKYTKRKEIVETLLKLVGLEETSFERYPHEFSGGQRQRICIARALALNPRFIICDESVSALDVSVQAQILNLLKEIQQKFKLTCIFISHDLSVTRFMSDRIMVMRKGEIIELGTAEEIVNTPKIKYTKELLDSVPQFSKNK
ncbi:dipeptide ABC transporter ATP-binding protein [Candidatus Atelocyanobacterium thalassae]|uniref:ATPase component of various ABC-type transport systems with duplicated ATPase domain n=1 Tax=Atelocyanobacterium thalassa (isolate ALOHA) TaxID=1453429 RepID=D3ENP8_ATETH|nr:ABC transporter ATP-binding protein [Candidatus Atelocyanobacterium thalassa]ADB95098.1 ATPase component of various ABC-type transport systems with duplicated ATPase domain [Candidatus Atelocyanobacterium thalassa isolate ALOHA]|tara:strand:- start:55051 stop:56889 length:1839 start_codon:yes stop_codon:yes gene_type:complete